MAEKLIYRSILIFYVFLVYAFYPSNHLFLENTPQSLYQYQTEGFLSGYLHLSIAPSNELLQLNDPYNPEQNITLRLHDASLYQGKYYSYFGVLPVLTFFLPVKLLTGLYPSDSLAVFFFLSLAFIINFTLMIKIRDRYFSFVSELQLLLAGFILAFTTEAPFLLSIPKVYEIAIASAFCFMSLAITFLYRIMVENSTNAVLGFSVCLSLSVAGRPHFTIVCGILILGLLIFLLPKKHNKRLTLLLYLLLPPLCVAIGLGIYNYQRFGSALELGHIWQLSCNNIKALHEELTILQKIPRNVIYSFYYYFLQPFTLNPQFPFFKLRLHDCRYHIDNDYFLEAVGGILATTPFILIVFLLPKFIYELRHSHSEMKPFFWFLGFTAVIPFINISFLLLLPFALQRYEMDFHPYLIMLAIISFWLLQKYWRSTTWFWLIKVLFYSLAIFSIILGLCFGLAYWVFFDN